MKFLLSRGFLSGVFLLGLVLVIMFLWVSPINKICGSNINSGICESTLFLIGVVSKYAIIPLLAPVILTVPFSLKVFNSWKRFAIFAAPAVVVLSLLVDYYWGGGNRIGAGVYAALIIIALYVLYFTTSIGIIAWAAWRDHKHARLQG